MLFTAKKTKSKPIKNQSLYKLFSPQKIKTKFFFFYFFGIKKNSIQKKTNKQIVKQICWLAKHKCSLCCSIDCYPARSCELQKINSKNKNNNYKRQHQKIYIYIYDTNYYYNHSTNHPKKHCWCCLLNVFWIPNKKTAKPKLKNLQKTPNAILTKSKKKPKQKPAKIPLIGLPWIYARCLQTCRIWMPFCTSAGYCGPTRWWFHYGVHGRRKR